MGAVTVNCCLEKFNSDCERQKAVARGKNQVKGRSKNKRERELLNRQGPRIMNSAGNGENN